MVYFHTQNTIFGVLWKASGWKILVYFMALGYFKYQFGIFLSIQKYISGGIRIFTYYVLNAIHK
jgi:hypothetical protein